MRRVRHPAPPTGHSPISRSSFAISCSLVSGRKTSVPCKNFSMSQVADLIQGVILATAKDQYIQFTATIPADEPTYEVWNPSTDYTALTVQIFYANDTLVSELVLQAGPTIVEFYSLVDAEEALNFSTDADTETTATSINAEPTFNEGNIGKRGHICCRGFCGNSQHWGLTCPKCSAYRNNTWRKKCSIMCGL